ncbi:hypothetical protein JCM10450v2_008282 [Rhodotorula kratochvilovae]
MAAIVVLSAAYALMRSREGLRDLRSPLIPLPDDHDDAPPPGGSARGRSLARQLSRSRPPPLTERSLRASHLAWLIRLRDLTARCTALEDARAKGFESCWAGKATRRHVRAVRRAMEEAEWVEDKLRHAVVWCRQAGIRKAPVKSLLAVGKNGFSARPKHSAFPPSLLELPFPLPAALEANIYFLTVPRPPPLARHESWDAERAAQTVEAPPMYTEEASLAFGEVVLERGEDLEVGAAMLEYERASHGMGLVPTQVVAASA